MGRAFGSYRTEAFDGLDVCLPGVLDAVNTGVADDDVLGFAIPHGLVVERFVAVVVLVVLVVASAAAAAAVVVLIVLEVVVEAPIA